MNVTEFVPVELFQFHSGSIQTINGVSLLIQSHAVSIPLWFDSNVALQDLSTQAQLFQFHSGSIQTSLILSAAIVSTSFNSTLVRFKLGLRSFNLFLLARFNSTLVRFKLK